MRRVLSVVVACLVGPIVLAGPASAQDQWTTPQRLPSGRASMVAVASSGSGDIFSTYSANGVLEVSRRPGGRWLRGRDPVGGGGTGVVVDDGGNVTVAYPAGGYCPWDEGDEFGDRSDFHIEARFRPFGSEDWRVFQLPGQWDGCEQSEPSLDVDRKGTVTAVWSGDGYLHAAQRRLGQRWSRPVVIGRSSGTEFDVAATAGKVTAVWAATGAVRSATSREYGRWGEKRKVAEPAEGTLPRVEHLRVVGTGRGSLLAAWSDSAVRDREWHHRVRFATADRLGRWRAPRTVERISAEPVWVHAVLTAAHGSRAVLAWHVKQRYAEDGGPLRVRVRTRGAWSSTKLLDRRADLVGPNGLAATDSGAALVWTGGDAGNYWPLARTRRWAGAWGETHLLSTQGTAELMESWVPWVVAWKPGVFTAAFPRDGEVWSSDLQLGAAR